MRPSSKPLWDGSLLFQDKTSLAMQQSLHSLRWRAFAHARVFSLVWIECSPVTRQKSLIMRHSSLSLGDRSLLLWDMVLTHYATEFSLAMGLSSLSLRNWSLLLRDTVFIHYVTEFSLVTGPSSHSLRDGSLLLWDTVLTQYVNKFSLAKEPSSHSLRDAILTHYVT